MALKKNHEDFLNSFLKLTNHDEYVIIGKYINAKTPIKFKHKKCGNIFFKSPHSFLNKNNKCKCPKCNPIKKKDHFDFIKEINKKYNYEYTILDKYIKNKIKVTVRHNICNYEYQVLPTNILRGSKCPFCFKSVKKTTENFKLEIYNLVKDEYKVLEEYITAKTKINFLHIKCNSIYSVTPDNFLRGYRCPVCKESKGEKKIENFLNENKLDYLRQYKINDCKNIKPLPFDFAIFKNDKLFCLIEYDGEFHFEESLTEHQKNIFKKTIINTKLTDKIKTNYCINNNIKLIRIAYTEYKNIENIINGVLQDG